MALTSDFEGVPRSVVHVRVEAPLVIKIKHIAPALGALQSQDEDLVTSEALLTEPISNPTQHLLYNQL